MFGKRSPEVLVAGAGPVGLFAALQLATRGVRVEIVDTGVWACAHSYALALDPNSVRLFQEAGLFERIMESACPVHAIVFYDGAQRRARLCFDSAKTSCLAVVRQDALERLLEKALAEAGVEVGWRKQVSKLSEHPDCVSVTVDRFEKQSRGYWVAHTEWMVAGSEEIEPLFVAGADGYNSQVRRALGIPFPEVGLARYFAVFEFDSDAELSGEMRIVLHEGTTSVLWPLPEGRCRWSFELPDYSDREAEETKLRLEAAGFGDTPTTRIKDRMWTSAAAESAVLDELNLTNLIAKRAPWFSGSIGAIRWRTIVRFERRLASRFGNGRSWLAGDAAHLAGPAAVNSMNIGLAEAHDLAETLTRVIQGGEPAAILDGYGERWTGVWRKVHNLEKLKAGENADPWVRAHAREVMECLPGFGRDLSALAAQIGFEDR